MNEEREIYGTFNNGLNVGANQAEQLASGVNPFDNATTAYLKVSNARIAADAAFNAKLQAQGYYGYGVKAPSGPFPWPIILNFLVLALLGWLFYITYQSGKYTYLGERWVPLKSASVPAKSLKDMQATNMLRISPLFTPGTPVQDIYKGCKTANCYEPDISAFDNFKKFAAHPDNYEGDLCNYYIGPTGYQPEQVQPIWKIDRKASTCVVKNFSVVRADVLAKNKTYMMKIAVFAAISLALLIGFNVLLRKSNK